MTSSASERSEEHTSELQSHSEISYAVFCLKKKNKRVDRKSTRLNSSHIQKSRMPYSARKKKAKLPPADAISICWIGKLEPQGPHIGGLVGEMRDLFFFNDTATTEIYTLSYTLSLHDALPI